MNKKKKSLYENVKNDETFYKVIIEKLCFVRKIGINSN